MQDPASRAMLEEIVNDGRMHLERLEELGMSGVGELCLLRVEDLKISEFVRSKDITEFSSFQDILVFAMKREQLAAHTYSTIARDAPDPEVRRLFELLSLEKLNHKHRLEALYDDLVYRED